MGIVYEAYDTRRNMRVALKKLRRLEPRSLYRFKREFRALSSLSHPHIIRHYELVSENQDWFLTMELISGRDIISHVRPPQESLDAGARVRAIAAIRDDFHWEETAETSAADLGAANPLNSKVGLAMNSGPRVVHPEPGEGPVPVTELVDLARLEAVMGPLAHALHTAHSAGLVHRDLKPAHVRITDDDRVVLMDFGIVAAEDDRSHHGVAVGTPSFMAPEQARGEKPTAAADWYAFGVILYLALTGVTPFSGTTEQILYGKEHGDPLPVHAFACDVPVVLEELCMRLLARDPGERPDGAEVLDYLGVRVEDISGIFEIPDHAASAQGTFVGRREELEILHAAFHRANAGETACVFVHGPSGIGKSTVLERFVRQLEGERTAPGGVLCLHSRCLEQESMAYKAFDGVVDDLGHALDEFSQERLAGLLPDDFPLLTRIFPVLRSTTATSADAASERESTSEIRSRAVVAFRDLLAALGADRPVVLRIDDLQWADLDSLELLVELLRPPMPGRLLVLATLGIDALGSREREVKTRLAEIIDSLERRGICRSIELGPLSPGDQRRLVSKLARRDQLYDQIDARLLRESAGSPMLLAELARYLKDEPDSRQSGAGLHLEDVLRRRVAQLHEHAQTLMAMLTVAGEPTPLSVLASALGLSDEDRERASAMLRVANLARATFVDGEPWLSVYHEKIRDAVAGQLTAERRRELHGALARVLDGWSGATSARRARHWRLAGDDENALRHLLAAATEAVATLAFEQAAVMCRRALELLPDSDRERRAPTLTTLAEALAAAGHHGEAAVAYGDAADCSTGDQAALRSCLSCDHHLRAGRTGDGMTRLDAALRELGAERGPGRALRSLFSRRDKLLSRGLDSPGRGDSPIAPGRRARLDALYRAVTQLGVLDLERAAAVQFVHLDEALRRGDARHIGRALALEIGSLGAMGGRSAERGQAAGARLVARIDRNGDGGDPLLVALLHQNSAVAAFFGDRPGDAQSHSTAASAALEGLPGAEWQWLQAVFFELVGLIRAGAYERLRRRLERALAAAEARENRYATQLLEAGPKSFCLLLDDRVEQAHGELDRLHSEVRPRHRHLLLQQLQLARARAYLYQGNGPAALECIEAVEETGSLLGPRAPSSIFTAADLRARSALIMGEEREVLAAERRIAKLDLPISAGHGALLRAQVCARQGQSREAETLLKAALAGAEAHGLAQIRAVCQYRLGQLRGAAGSALVAGAMDWLGPRVTSPQRMLAFLSPGWTR